MVGGRVAFAPAAGLAVALSSGAMPAQAMTPPCSYDPATGRLVSPDKAGPDAEAVPYSTAPNGFVTWEVTREAGGRTLIDRAALQHCASGQELMVVFPATGNRAAHDLWESLVWGEGSHTLQDVADRLKQAGARPRLSRNALGSCACDTLGAVQ